MRSSIITTIALAGCLALVGCGQDDSTGGQGQSPSPVMVTVTADPGSASPEASTTSSDARGGLASVVPQQTATAAGTATATSTGAASVDPDSSPTARADATVDPGPYALAGGFGAGHYFRSGALRCGITQSATGCQSTASVANRPACTDPDSKAPYVAEDGTEPSADGCTTQGLFITEKPAPELAVGKKLTVGRATCEAKAVGSVVCTTTTGVVTANSQVFGYKAR